MLAPWTGQITVTCLAIFMLLVGGSALSDDRERIVVRANHLACVLENLDAYLGVKKDPVIVFFSLCPSAEPSGEEVLALATNTLPAIRVSPESESAKPVLMHPFLKSELNCIRELHKAGKLELPKDQAIETVQLDLDQCRN